MCGYLITNLTLEKKKFSQALKKQEYRGPDNSRVIKINNVFFGFNRLSIIDLSDKSMQPLSFKNFIMCFNGEIYNYKELRSELIENGVKFYSDGDGEVFLKIIYYFGKNKGLKKIRGMWSAIIYDTKKNEFFISRDRIGIKPLWYYTKDSEFIFSTDIKSILYLIDNLNVSENSIQDFLKYGILDESNKTFFEKIMMFPKGSYSNFNEKKKIKKIKFWKLNINKKKKFEKKKISNTFFKALDQHLNSDVPVAITLSGGLDSSLLASYYSQKKNIKNKIKFFSLRMEAAEAEYKNIDKLVTTFKLDHQYFDVKESETIENLDELIFNLGQPFRATQTFYQYLLRKEIRKQGYKVLLTGDGSDEIFAGYEECLNFFLAQPEIHDDKKEFLRYAQKMSTFSGKKITELREESKKIFINKKYLYQRVPDFELDSLKKKNSSFSKKKIYENINSLKEYMEMRLLKTPMPQWLRLEDGSSMANSLETRIPYLDHFLVEEAFSFDNREYFKGFKNKSILRRIAGNYLPKFILSTKKKYHRPGSTLNFLKKDIIKDELFKIIRESKSLFNKDKKISFEKKFLTNNADFLFRVLVISRWKKIFNFDFNF